MLTDKVNLKVAGPAEKHRLRTMTIRIIVIIILWYNKDIKLPRSSKAGESSDSLLLWYNEAWLGSAVG